MLFTPEGPPKVSGITATLLLAGNGPWACSHLHGADLQRCHSSLRMRAHVRGEKMQAKEETQHNKQEVAT